MEEYPGEPHFISNFQEMIRDNGTEQFLFGPPDGVEKIQGVHRNYIQPKLGQNIEFFAKKMREQYIRDNIYPETKIFLDAVRARQPNDTL